MKLLGILFLFIFAIGCAKEETLSKIQWSAQQGKPSEDVSHKLRLSQEKGQKTSLGKESVYLWQQKAGDFKVEGEWLHAIYKGNKPQYLKGNYFNEANASKFIEELNQLKEKMSQIIEQVKAQSLDLKSAKKIESEVVLGQFQGQWMPHIKVTYFNQNETQVWLNRVNIQGQIFETRRLGSRMVDGVGMVFKSQPDQSQLTEVIFKEMVGSGFLANSHIEILSEVPKRAFNTNHEFKYSPSEKHFNEVQAFYFANQCIQWMAEKLNVKLPFKLNIKLHMGGLNQTNAAFYYRGKIRLGDGDGKIYRDIPRDPTIVCHELSHAYVEMIARLPNEKEGGSLNEGFSDFLAANILGTPKMAEYSYIKGPFRRNLENKKVAHKDFSGSLYGDSLVVSGTFWEIRKQLGAIDSGQLAVSTLARLGSQGQLADFSQAVLDAASSLFDEDQQIKIKEVLMRRGWKTEEK